MSHFKSFFLGVGTAYIVYYITRKDGSGRSILDELLDHPKVFLQQAKDQAIAEAVSAVKEHLP